MKRIAMLLLVGLVDGVGDGDGVDMGGRWYVRCSPGHHCQLVCSDVDPFLLVGF